MNLIFIHHARHAAVTTLKAAVVSLLVSLIWLGGPAHAGRDVTGTWFNDTGQGAIELFRCGNAICGRIVWLKKPIGKSGQPLRDAHNPSPNRRNRPICGLQIISNAGAQSDGSWDRGRIYDPKVGKSYNVAIQRMSANRLRVTGYIGAKLFGKSFTWRRAPASLKRCRT